jgi:hypothetical protein
MDGILGNLIKMKKARTLKAKGPKQTKAGARVKYSSGVLGFGDGFRSSY